MNFIVIGCGRVGAELASRLYFRNYKVAVIDQNGSAFDNLHPDFRGQLIEGDSLNQDVLKRANISNADGLAAVTNSDSLNAVVAHIARSIYRVPNVVARNFDPNWRKVYESFDLQVVSSSSWGAQRIEELLYNKELRSIYSAGNGEVEIYEFSAPASWRGMKVAEISTNQCRLVSLSRAGIAILPSEAEAIMAGDIILVSATVHGVQELRRRLENKKGV